MRAPNVQIFTIEPMKISGIADGARLALYSRQGEELYNSSPENEEVFVHVEPDQYPVTIRVHKDGYVPFTLTGFPDGNMTQPEVT